MKIQLVIQGYTEAEFNLCYFNPMGGTCSVLSIYIIINIIIVVIVVSFFETDGNNF